MTTAVWAGLTVGEVARQSGVNASAVRFYERQGLVAATRTSGNQRRFGADAPCRIRTARVAQRIGLHVSEIRDLLAGLPQDPTTEDWQRLHAALVQEARRRITELNAWLDEVVCGRKLCEM